MKILSPGGRSCKKSEMAATTSMTWSSGHGVTAEISEAEAWHLESHCSLLRNGERVSLIFSSKPWVFQKANGERENLEKICGWGFCLAVRATVNSFWKIQRLLRN